jgi:hypothetical protein
MPCNELHPYVFSKKKQKSTVFVLITAQGIETLEEDGRESGDFLPVQCRIQEYRGPRWREVEVKEHFGKK